MSTENWYLFGQQRLTTQMQIFTLVFEAWLYFFYGYFYKMMMRPHCHYMFSWYAQRYNNSQKKLFQTFRLFLSLPQFFSEEKLVILDYLCTIPLTKVHDMKKQSSL